MLCYTTPVSCSTRQLHFLPVSEESTDNVLGIFGNLHIIWEVEGVFMVHDLAVSSHQRVSIEWCVT